MAKLPPGLIMESVSQKPGPSFFGLQARVTLLIVLLTLGVTAVSCGLYIKVAHDVTSRLQADQAVYSATVLARTASQFCDSGDRDGLRQLALDSANGYPLLFAVFSDVEGKPVAAADRDGDCLSEVSARGKRLNEDVTIGIPQYRKATLRYPPHLRVVYPIQRVKHGDIEEGPHLLGYVAVGLNLDRTLLQYGSAMDVASGIGLAALMLTIPLAFLVVRRIVVPLHELSSTAARLATGDLTARSGVRRGDEIGMLAGSFNEMAEKLARSHRDVVELNEDLERRVRDRTRQLTELADREPLTGLYNRRYFNESLERRFSESIRYHNDLSCMMLDIDDFKSVNDLCGHHVGDVILKLLASIIKGQLRAADLAARYGGDEFVVLLPHTSAEQARILGERILEQFYLETTARYPQVRSTVSIGIANLFDGGAETADHLIRAADQALYRAKQHGKNRVAMA